MCVCVCVCVCVCCVESKKKTLVFFCSFSLFGPFFLFIFSVYFSFFFCFPFFFFAFCFFFCAQQDTVLNRKMCK